MSRTADALLATAAALARPDMAQELDFEGGLEQFGRRLVATLVAFADLHWGCITSLEKKYGWLQHVRGRGCQARVFCMCWHLLCCLWRDSCVDLHLGRQACCIGVRLAAAWPCPLHVACSTAVRHCCSCCSHMAWACCRVLIREGDRRLDPQQLPSHRPS